MVTESTTLAPTPPKLLDQIRDKIRVKHYSIRTVTQYVHWIKRFIFFNNKQHPRDLGAVDVKAF
jgi:Phage integrase, N-terminal SAM-like domain